MGDTKRPEVHRRWHVEGEPRTMAVAHILAGDKIRHEDRDLTVTDRRWHVESDGLHTTLDLDDADGHHRYSHTFGPRAYVELVATRGEVEGDRAVQRIREETHDVALD